MPVAAGGQLESHEARTGLLQTGQTAEHLSRRLIETKKLTLRHASIWK